MRRREELVDRQPGVTDEGTQGANRQLLVLGDGKGSLAGPP